MKKGFLFASVTMMVAMTLSCDNKTNKNDKTVEVTDSTVVSLASETTTEVVNDEVVDDNVVALIPNTESDQPIDYSKGSDKEGLIFPTWDEDDIWDEGDVLSYDINIGADHRHLQTLHEELPERPADKQEVGRLILIDLNFDGFCDLAVCRGRFGGNQTLFFDGYIWDDEDGVFVGIPEFRSIAWPEVDTENQIIKGSRPIPDGAEMQQWEWKQGKLVKTKEWIDSDR